MMTPTMHQKMKSSTSSAFQVLPGRAAWRRASHQAAAKPTTYMIPYQWICTGPSAGRRDLMSGYVQHPAILSGNVAEQGLEVARLRHGRMHRMIR